jgi:hypothetical protein
MTATDEFARIAVLAVLFAAVFAFHIRFPRASRHARTVMLACAMLLFVFISHVFLPNDPAAIVKADVAHPYHSRAGIR